MEQKDGQLFRSIKAFLNYRFNLHRDSASEEEINASIRNNSEFVGTNLWTLIFAIFIASIGLNVNSTAVIIGAMLISPLMGPIMGIGLGLGINDFELVKKGARNLMIATVISVITSTLYFYISPLHDAQSELLARTTPSVWDVFIAFFGGLAGIVAQTRKEKSNVIPGVAIATALMPPLCTAGYGIANGNIYYCLGALYLYFINTVFIGISTYLIVRFLKFERKHFEDKGYEKKVSRYIITIITITIIPSVYFAYKIVQKGIFENNAQRFIIEQFNFRNTQVVNRNIKYGYNTSEIDLLLLGQTLSEKLIDSIRKNMAGYNIGDAKLKIRQGLDARQEIDFAQIKASILEDVIKKDSIASTEKTAGSDIDHADIPDIRAEYAALFPNAKYYSADRIIYHAINSNEKDTVIQVVTAFRQKITVEERGKLKAWLSTRLKDDRLKLIIE